MVSDAGKRKVTECLVGDSSATILFKARGREAEELTEGRSLRIQGCKVDMFHGSMRLVCQPEASIDEITDVSPKARPVPALPFLRKAHVRNAWCPRARAHGACGGGAVWD